MTDLNTDVNKYFDLIEDVVAQADEVDNKYLQVIFLLLLFEHGSYGSAPSIEVPISIEG